MRSGVGRFTWTEKKEYYEGEFKQNMMHGKGKMQYSDGSYYIGQFVFNSRDGLGKMVWTDGSYFIGSWKNGFRDGVGTEKVGNELKIENYAMGKKLN